MSALKCPRCGGDDLKIVHRNEVDSRGAVLFMDELTGCNTYDYEFYTFEQSMANSRAHAAALAARSQWESNK